MGEIDESAQTRGPAGRWVIAAWVGYAALSGGTCGIGCVDGAAFWEWQSAMVVGGPVGHAVGVLLVVPLLVWGRRWLPVYVLGAVLAVLAAPSITAVLDRLWCAMGAGANCVRLGQAAATEGDMAEAARLYRRACLNPDSGLVYPSTARACLGWAGLVPAELDWVKRAIANDRRAPFVSRELKVAQLVCREAPDVRFEASCAAWAAGSLSERFSCSDLDEPRPGFCP